MQTNRLAVAPEPEKTEATSIAGGRDEILTVGEVAQRLRVPPSWVYSHTDLLGAYRLGKYLRFSWGRVLNRISGSPNQ